ncbi:hypothetical protein E2C01_044148 [Portunus trituberculatus]|uniref:Uncharacterized protein n=1 Tax=Portunus trituberculatus TaxID=210409 RepID=A0A5B7FZ67_PORTR|nr:hypothetical protein [Portunus trituberculatus]
MPSSRATHSSREKGGDRCLSLLWWW